ncbi:hypothetical protein GGI03_000823 [Coemansia sp. RSA 2337]|nr:hypothetical protein H4S03_003777 [Coemansia sp. S3946]KAJ2073503.1 hypothetical protein GGH13_001952 [Coemansia sp. S155-1]KAJ2109907.1 hypothetical protein IW146_006140 [Coemansia sp. RSA 922]KAJ2468717.1 hypothetical protein GGI03_000823 [Coemansia sp. RSA 2337]
MSYTILDFKPDTALLNPRFDGYKLRLADSEDTTSVYSLESEAVSPQKLPSSTPLSYDEASFRVHYNHLFIGPRDSTFIYIDTAGVTHMVYVDKHSPLQMIALFAIPQKESDSALAGYPGAYTLSENLILLFDGIESAYVIQRLSAAKGSEQWSAIGLFGIGPGPMAAGPTEPQAWRRMYSILGAALVREAGQILIRLHVCYRIDRTAETATGLSGSRGIGACPSLALPGVAVSRQQTPPPFCVVAVEVDLSQLVSTSDLQAAQPYTPATLNARTVHTLRSRAIPVYCEYTADDMYVLGVRDGVEQDDTESASRPHSPSEASLSAVLPCIPDLYYWSQTSSDVTMCMELPVNVDAKQIQCVLTRGAITLQFNEVPECEAKYGLDHTMLCDEIVADDSVWTIENGRLLTLYLQKVHEGARWPTLFSKDDGVLETMDPNEFAVIRERLQRLTSDSFDTRRPAGMPTMALATEEVDQDSDELEQESSSVVFSVRDWRTGLASASSVAGSPGWLCPSFSRPLGQRQGNELPPVCLRFDVDGTVFGFNGATHANSNADASICPRHWGTFAALSYIQASKREKRFMYVDPDMTVAVLAETQRRIYIYHQVDSADSSTAAQSVVDLGGATVTGETEEVLGIQLSGRMLVVLRERSICTVNLDRC